MSEAAQAQDASPIHEIDTVTVYGRGVEAQTAREIPQSLTVFSRKILESIPGASVGDVVRFLPAASSGDGSYSAFQSFSIRGARPSYSLNSTIPSPASNAGRPNLANVERIEVLMGPSSITYGSMQPGALINIVTKQPTAELFSQVDLQGGSFGTHRAAVDVGGPLSDRVRVRLNASYMERGSPFDHWSHEDLLIAPVVEFDLTDRTLLTFEASYQREDYPDGIFDGRVPVSGTLLPNPNGRIPLALNTAHFDDTTHFSQKYSVAQLRLKHEFSESVSLSAQLTRDRVRAGGVDGYGNFLTADNRTVERALYARDDNRDNTLAAVNLAFKFKTGTIEHSVVAGFDYLDAEAFAKGLGQYNSNYYLDVFSPDYSSAGVLTMASPLDYTDDLEVKAGFVQERAALGEHLSLIAGARYSDSTEELVAFFPASNTVVPFPDTTAKEWSTQFGALYRVSDDLTFYASRNTSFVPRAGVLLRDGSFYSNPETAVQYEIGSKMTIPGSDLTANLAWFHIERPDVLTPDPVDPSYQIPSGELTSKGIEASVSGAIVPGWSAFVAYAYNPTEVTRSNVAGMQGREYANAPKQTFSLISRYDVSSGPLQGLGVSVAVNHLSDKFADAANALVLPSTTRVDLGLYYQLSEAISINLQGNNITDEEIYNGFLPTLVARNAGRHYLLSVKILPQELFR